MEQSVVRSSGLCSRVSETTRQGFDDAVERSIDIDTQEDWLLASFYGRNHI